MKKFLMYFMRGLLVTVPVVITITVIYQIITFVGSFFSGFGVIVSLGIDPFIYTLIAIGIVFFMGLLGSSIILSPLFNLLDNALEHTPFIKLIYSSIKDLISAFVGNKKRFDKPVMVLMDKENNIRRLGFVTQKSLSDLKIQEGLVAVYIPMSYSLSGHLFVLPAESVTPVDAKSSDVMKFIVSGGVSEIDGKE